MPANKVQEYDVLVIGAGLSGINSAYRLKEALPDVNYCILEKRDVIGGTWSFWKYPGIRSDSSLALFGFPWYPWPHGVDFAPGPLIAEYIQDAASREGIDKCIKFSHKVLSTDWSSDEQLWVLHVASPDGNIVAKAGWILMCGGYYNYDHPRNAEIPGLDNFKGEVVHPQFWDPETDYTGKKVVIIGSGATAITLLPNLCEKAAHVTMLQRSPSYVMSLPIYDTWTGRLRRWLGVSLGSRIDWWRRIILEFLFVQFLLRFPSAGRNFLTAETKRRLPEGFPVDEHFNPWYDPFQQRLCFCPDNDFFNALARPNCDVVTSEIDTCDKTGIRLKPKAAKGAKLGAAARIDADMIITATGLRLELFGGGAPSVDGKPMPVGERYVWRSCMLDGLPNACAVMGYTTGTWTPGADVHIQTVLKVMKHMRKLGATSVRPYISPEERAALPRLPVSPNNSTYIVEAQSRLPISTGKDPWQNGQNWFSDAWYQLFGRVTKGLMFIVPDKKSD